MISILIFLLIITTAVVFHEAAHYLAAKSVGIPVRAFSVGMGPVILKKRWRDTEWRISLFPVGGYVDIPSMGAKIDEDGNAEHRTDGFAAKKLWQKLMVLGAGVVANYILAILLLSTAITVLPNYRQITSKIVPQTSGAKIAGLIEGKHAETLGVQVGDVIIEINGIKNPNADMVSKVIREADKMLSLRLKRDGKIVEISTPWPPEDSKAEARPLFGIQVQPLKVSDLPKISFLQAIAETTAFSFRIVPEMISGMVKGFASAFSPKQSEDIMGPVGIVKAVDGARRVGLIPVLALSAFINFSLAVFNLLPIPGLDGGRMLMATIVAIRGKPLPAGREEYIHFLGFMMVLALILIITFKEIGGLVFSG